LGFCCLILCRGFIFSTAQIMW